MFPLRQYEENGVTVLEMQGITNFADSRQMKKQLTEISRLGLRLVVDFTSVEYVGSSVLGVLATEVKKFKDLEGDIRLAGLNESLRRLFQITCLDEIFKIYPDVKSAIASFYS